MSNNFNNWTNNAGRDINVHINETQPVPAASYEAEPVWRSPITMAVLTWIGFFTSVGSLVPLYKFVEPLINWGRNSFKGGLPKIDNPTYIFLFIVLVIFLGITLSLRRMTKYQTRYPLIFNYAVSGVDKRITFEKITVSTCPECGGKMKYYNKPEEWLDFYDDRGNIKKRKVTKRVPALECKRNSNHSWYVDPAGTKI